MSACMEEPIQFDISPVKFNENGLVPAIAQDSRTSEVLMMAWMDKVAIEKTIATGRAHYFSRSRGRLWQKGESSGNFQEVRSIRYDCDGDTLLLLVEPRGPACHTGERTCFYRALDGGEVKPSGPAVLTELMRVLAERKDADPAKSYVASLYARGLTKILDKIEEESGELLEAANYNDNGQVVYELSDLLFHCLVLLSLKGIGVDEVFGELARRFGISGIAEKEARGGK